MRNLFLSLTAIAILAGCASVPKAPEAADSAAKSFQVAPDKANLYVFRKPAVAGSAVAVQVSVDGRMLGSTGAGTYFLVRLDPGTHVVSSFTPESAPALTLTVEAGRNYFVEQKTHFGLANARTSLHELSESEGRAAVMKCRLLASAYR